MLRRSLGAVPLRAGDANLDLDRDRERLVEMDDTESEPELYEDTERERLRADFPGRSLFRLGLADSSTGLQIVRQGYLNIS